MNVSDFVFQFLADYGVKHVFMVSGGGTMFLNDALGRQKRIKHVCTHHEQGASIAADGYARVTNSLAVASVTTGPGGTNTMTGLIGAWLDSQPILFISGQVKFSTTTKSRPSIPLRQLGDQENNIVDMVKPVTKYAVMVTDPKKIRYELEKAVYLATTGRKGPVWLDIPINVQSANIDNLDLEPFIPSENNITVNPSDVITVAEILANSKSPVIIAGQGIRLADAISDFQELVGKLQIPVLGTFCGFDILPSQSPYSIGPIGTIGTRAGNIALQSADVILCLSTRNNIRQASYNYENFGRNAKHVIVVDIDQAELDKNTVRITCPIHAEVKCFIRELLNQLKTYSVPSAHKKWLEWTQLKKKSYSSVLPEYTTVQDGVQPYYFIQKLSNQIEPNAVVGCANATPSIAMFQAGIIKTGQRVFANSGFGAMGYGLPATVGAAFAAEGTGRQVICLEGDGSLMMNIQELQTITHYDMPIKLFLFNNGEYASIRQTHDNFFEGRHTGCDKQSGVSFPNWENIAKAFDWSYVKIDSQIQLDKQIEKVLAMSGRVFCDVVLTPKYCFSPKLSARRLPDGSMISPSLEDMFPFLPEEEMKGNYYQAND